MPRKLPWKTAPLPSPSSHPPPRPSSPTSSPPPSPPPLLSSSPLRSTTPLTQPEISFMHEGAHADDAWIMVEDEFYDTAKLFTAQLHQEEYLRVKRLARARPVVKPLDAELARAGIKIKLPGTTSAGRAKRTREAWGEEDVDEGVSGRRAGGGNGDGEDGLLERLMKGEERGEAGMSGEWRVGGRAKGRRAEEDAGVGDDRDGGLEVYRERERRGKREDVMTNARGIKEERGSEESEGVEAGMPVRDEREMERRSGRSLLLSPKERKVDASAAGLIAQRVEARERRQKEELRKEKVVVNEVPTFLI